MSEIWTFPSSQAMAVALLRANGYPDAQSRQPKPLASGAVRIWRIGGGRKDLVQDQPLLMWHVWNEDSYLAERDCERIRAIIHELSNAHVLMPNGDGGHMTYVAEPAGPVESPDPDSSLYRWQGQAYVLVHIRKESL